MRSEKLGFNLNISSTALSAFCGPAKMAERGSQ